MTSFPVLGSQDYFMSVAFINALKSGDPSTKAGACIVNQEKNIVAVGCNRAPGKLENIPWNKNISSDEEWLNSKYPYILYAEMDAILNKTCSSLEGCTLYTLIFPWNECAKLIVESGIKKVVYFCDKYPDNKYIEGSKRLFNEANIVCTQFKLEVNNEISQKFFQEIANKTIHFKNYLEGNSIPSYF